MKKKLIIIIIILFLFIVSIIVYNIFNYKLLDSKSELLYSLKISDKKFLQVYHTYGSTINDYIQIFTIKNDNKKKYLIKIIENGVGFISMDTLSGRKYLLFVVMKNNTTDSVIVNLAE